MRKLSIQKPMTRPPLERMQRIFRIVKEGKCPSRATLAREIEVTTKTIQRDIDFMRDRLHLPIAHNRKKNGYEFTSPVEASRHRMSSQLLQFDSRAYADPEPVGADNFTLLHRLRFR